MADHLGIERAGDDDAGPTVLRKSTVAKGIQRLTTTVHLNQAVPVAQNDRIYLGKRPAGSRFAGGDITSGVTFGATATLAVGTDADAAKYKAAATHTTVDQPVRFGKATAMADDAVTEDEDLWLTVAAAAAPTSDHYLVVNVDLKLA